MGLAPGGRMRQEIYRDPYKLEEWSEDAFSRCFVHICNSTQWREVTGEMPTTKPPTAAEYIAAGLPWFEYYSDSAPLGGSRSLAGMKSVGALARRKRTPLEGKTPVGPVPVIPLHASLRPGQVREWAGE